jgi:hypothetical protein
MRYKPSQSTPAALGEFIRYVARELQRIASAISYVPTVRIVSSVANVSQDIPYHDGTLATEININIGDFADDYVKYDGAEILLLKGIESSILSISLNTRSTGGGNKIAALAVWTEVSIDQGVTWFVRSSSLRVISVADESHGSQVYLYSSMSPLPKGVRFRIVATNVGDPLSNVSLISDETVVTSKGVVDGQSAHATFTYTVKES